VEAEIRGAGEAVRGLLTVFIALGEDGQPSAVKTWSPVSDEEIAMRNYAVKLMDLRKGIEEEMRPYIQG
jgi:hypothetical protein